MKRASFEGDETTVSSTPVEGAQAGSSRAPSIGLNLKKRRRTVLTLAVLLVGLWVIAGLVVVQAAKDMRITLALERNMTIARLSARLIDEQADNALSTMRVFSRRFPLESALEREDRAELKRYLSSTVDLVPDLLGVSAHRADGRLVTKYWYPKEYPLPAPSTCRKWFRAAVAQGGPMVSDVIHLRDPSRTEAIALVHPLSRHGVVLGYLVAYYRLFEIDEWLGRVRIGDHGVVYVFNSQAHLVTSTNIFAQPSSSRSSREALRLALGEPFAGSLVATDIAGNEEATIGYARAVIPRWTVLAVQPTDAAFAPTIDMLSRLGILMVPILVAVLFSAWLLVRLYERLEEVSVALARQNEALRKADRVKSDFLANVSHDLRTPLASVQLCISGVLESPDRELPQDTRESLSMASEEVDHLTRRVRNLLDMSKLEAGVQTPAFETADLTDIVAGALERLRPVLQGRPVTADFPAEPLFLECDQTQIETVVMNLVENACKYSPNGTPLALRGWSDRICVCCSVADSGPGVPEQDTERIFTKFYRSAGVGPAGGTGLGLAIAKAIIDAHGGKIGVSTAETGGAEFRFSLPLARPRARSKRRDANRRGTDKSAGAATQVQPDGLERDDLAPATASPRQLSDEYETADR